MRWETSKRSSHQRIEESYFSESPDFLSNLLMAPRFLYVHLGFLEEKYSVAYYLIIGKARSTIVLLQTNRFGEVKIIRDVAFSVGF